ncbi:hypothetical protein BP6252_11235 [Coleophoma cylindrospora]|uniref:Fatty acid hydroxylase domain-containing protein n=1 Tax=Coleophoma cylindrospora TaxID=1849047 RepID=A0A3D8QPX6_9HELO|nr:hypothetical protein BP6252_11235 [Coleophoma cylindrospora]
MFNTAFEEAFDGFHSIQPLHHIYKIFTKSPPQVTVLYCLWLYLAGSFTFDIVHYSLHQCSKSSFKILRSLGYLHQVHHFYFNSRLKFNEKYRWQNICLELPLELACQICGAWLGWLIAHTVGFTEEEYSIRDLFFFLVVVQTVRVLVVVAENGHDSNHISYEPMVPKDNSWFWVGPQYHALHHVDPSAYIGSTIRLFDWILGTGSSLRSRRITMTGSSGAFGQAMRSQLIAEGAKSIQELKFRTDWTYDDYQSVIPILTNTDILILAHGSKSDDSLNANCECMIELIETFKQNRKAKSANDMLLPEVWYVGSEAELHPSWGSPTMQSYSRSKRSFLPYARHLYSDPSLLYRHIVPSSFNSSMGFAIVSVEWAARVTLWWIKRGARYVPVTYTGLAYVNYFKFRFGKD